MVEGGKRYLISATSCGPHCKKFKIFSFILFKKRRVAQGIRQPKAADPPLGTIPSFQLLSKSNSSLINSTSYLAIIISFNCAEMFTKKHSSICCKTKKSCIKKLLKNETHESLSISLTYKHLITNNVGNFEKWLIIKSL